MAGRASVSPRRAPMATAPAPARSVRRDKQLALVVVVVPAVLLVALAVSRIAYPYDVGQYEANAWAPASLLANLHNPYSESLATQPPFVAAPYGPAYYAIIGIGVHLFGDQFWFFRAAALVCALLSALLVFRIAQRFTADRFSAALGAGLLLAQYPMLSWAGVQRPDVLALAFALAGLDLGLRREDGHSHAFRPILSALVLTAAALTRQTYVMPIVIVALWYLSNQDYRALRRFLVTVVAVGGALVGLLSITSRGGFLTNLVTNQTHAKDAVSILTSHVRALAEAPITWLTSILLVLGIVAASTRLVRAARDASDHQERQRILVIRLLLGYLVLATVVALLAAARAGSNINYFIEPLAVASLLVGLLGRDALHLTSERRRIAVVAVLCVGLLVMAVRQGHGELVRWQAKPYFSELVGDARKVPASAGPVYSDYPELVDGAGRVVYVNDFVQYDGRSPALKHAFDRLMQARKLTTIVSANPQAPPGYVRVATGERVPTGVYVAYLFVRRDLTEYAGGR